MTGIFASVSSLPGQYLLDLADHIRSHRCVSEIVWTDLLPWSWSSIDSAGQVTDQAWVGATEVPWYGPRWDTPSDLQPWMAPIAGVAGMLTPSYRWDQIYRDLEIFAGAAQRGLDLYIRQEVGIDALGDHPRVRAGWEAYLIELVRRANQIRPGVKVLWSPYAWDTWASVSSTRRGRVAAALRTLVANVRAYSGLTDLDLTIDLQDGRGAQPDEPESDAVNWWRLVKDCGARVRINAEWWGRAGYVPESREVMTQRLAAYETAGVPVGCCWHAPFWLIPLHVNH